MPDLLELQGAPRLRLLAATDQPDGSIMAEGYVADEDVPEGATYHDGVGELRIPRALPAGAWVVGAGLPAYDLGEPISIPRSAS